jgi:hypothetical protein
MNFFIEADEHNKKLLELAKSKPDKIVMSTFGIYCGITKTNDDVRSWGYTSNTRNILDEMIDKCNDITILIGISCYQSCRTERCRYCENKYIMQTIRYLNHVDTFKSIKWRYSLDMHLKAYLFYHGNNKYGIIGGRNFTDSEWIDLTVSVDGENFDKVEKHVMLSIDKSYELTPDSLYHICLKSGISNKTVDEIIEQEYK